MKDQVVEIIGRGHYGLYNWERIKFGQFPDVSLEDAQWVFDTAEEIHKMLFPGGKKPPVLDKLDKVIEGWEYIVGHEKGTISKTLMEQIITTIQLLHGYRRMKVDVVKEIIEFLVKEGEQGLLTNLNKLAKKYGEEVKIDTND